MTAPRPYALLAELTYRCPLHCPYCSNPTRARNDGELTTDEWHRVLREATELGVLQVGFSGGEPLVRRDLAELVRGARGKALHKSHHERCRSGRISGQRIARGRARLRATQCSIA